MNNKEQQDVEKLIVEYQPRLKAFIRKRVSSKEDADDILQEVFYQLAKVDTALNPIEQVAAWLYRVARNQIINKYKKKEEEALRYFASTQANGRIISGHHLFLASLKTPKRPSKRRP